MYKKYLEILSDRGISYALNEPMANHTSFRIGGPADVYVSPESAEELKDAYVEARNVGLCTYILGKGSNVLFDDGGFNGVIISTEKLNSVTVEGNVLTAECGASFTHIAAVARDHGLSGLEFAYGIPGAVGGAVYMNAGAYGGEVSQCLVSSTSFDPVSGKILFTEGADHAFAYRFSIYKKYPERVILSASFKLTPFYRGEIKFRMDDLMQRRKDKQPLEYPSAGSVFKRPEGYFVGQMIEELGLKGYTVGGAQISEKHAGFIINRGGAKCADVLSLVDFIKSKVYEKYNVELECELIYVK